MNNKPPLHLIRIGKKTEGGFTVEMEPEFEEWFLKSQKIDEWSDEVFHSWFKQFLTDAMKDRVGGKSDQQLVDVWSREGVEDE